MERVSFHIFLNFIQYIIGISYLHIYMSVCYEGYSVYRKRCRKTSLLVYIVNELEVRVWDVSEHAPHIILPHSLFNRTWWRVFYISKRIYRVMMMCTLSIHNMMPIFRWLCVYSYNCIHIKYVWMEDGQFSYHFKFLFGFPTPLSNVGCYVDRIIIKRYNNSS